MRRSIVSTWLFAGAALLLILGGPASATSATFSRAAFRLADSEPANNAWASAESMSKNTTVTGTLSNASDRLDLYKVPLSAGDIVNFTLSHAETSDPDAYFYTPGRGLLSQSGRYGFPDGDGEQFIQEITSAGSYYVGLECWVGSGTYTARAGVTQDAASTDVLPFTRGFVNARLASGADTMDTYSIPIPDDVADNRRVLWLLWNPNLTFRPHMDLFKEGTQVDTGAPLGAGQELIDYSPVSGQGGTYEVAVTPDASSAGAGAYDLYVLFASGMYSTSSEATATVTYGSSVTFKGHVTYSGPYDHSGSDVSVYRLGRTAGYGFRGLDGSDNYSVPFKPDRNGYYYAQWEADSDHDLAFTNDRYVGVKVKVGIGATPSTLPRGSSVRLYGSVSPRHRGTVYIQRLVSGSFRTVGSARLSTRSTWAWSTRPSRSSTYRAYYRGDLSHMKGYSARKFVRVR